MSQESGANIPKTYDPQSFERKWYAYWEEHNLFHDAADESREPYSVVIPPPNVTGQLHMGHALDNTLQDILVRYQRMRGKNVVWIPGCDHAGIATQAKVEESLRAEGTNRFELGREKFLARVWDWKQQYGDRIMYQLRMLGASCDWERERFTMDEGCSRAVREVFVSLYEQGLIYQGTRITNWCPHCTTAISDIEVDHETEEGHLWHLRYRIDGTDDYVEIATTRPETMFGDTGVAVHPDDERYKHLVGKTLILPVVERRIPLFADAYVDPAFGTGAVKVTPAHDPNDFEMGCATILNRSSSSMPTARWARVQESTRGLTVTNAASSSCRSLRRSVHSCARRSTSTRSGTARAARRQSSRSSRSSGSSAWRIWQNRRLQR